MSTTPTNCPHCGAVMTGDNIEEGGNLVFFECGSDSDMQSKLCRERAARQKAEAELAEAIRCLDAACVVQTNTTDRRQWVTYSGWLSPGDSLCEVALPPKNIEAKEGK